jgi:hypothetical protein
VVGDGDRAKVQDGGSELKDGAAGERLAGIVADGVREDDPRDGGKSAGAGVERDGEGGDAAGADPGGGERDECEAEEEGKVGPEDAVGGVLEVVDEVVVVDPIDTGLDEAEEIDQEERKEGAQTDPAQTARLGCVGVS